MKALNVEVLEENKGPQNTKFGVGFFARPEKSQATTA